MICNSLELTNKLSKEDLRVYEGNKPKGFIPFVAIAIGALCLVSVIAGIIMFITMGNYGFIPMIVAAVLLLLSFVFYLINDNKYKIKYARYIESALKKTAKDSDKLAISPVFSIYMKADDDNQILYLYHNDEVLVEAPYANVKNFNIYYNKEYLANRRLPDRPKKLVRSYSFELILSDDTKSTILFSNMCSKFLIGNKIDYLQLVNTKTINGLATIVEKIQTLNKKNK